MVTSVTPSFQQEHTRYRKLSKVLVTFLHLISKNHKDFQICYATHLSKI